MNAWGSIGQSCMLSAARYVQPHGMYTHMCVELSSRHFRTQLAWLLSRFVYGLTRFSHGSLQLQHSMFGPGHAQISRYRGPNPYKLVSAWQDSAEYYWFNAAGLLGGFVKNEAGDRPM